MFDFNNYLPKSKYCDNSNKLVIGKMKNETGGVAIEEFVGLKPKIYRFLEYDNSEQKKQKVWIEMLLYVTISHNKYKDALLNNKYLRYSINRIQSKLHTKKNTWNPQNLTALFWYKIYIQNNGYDRLALGYQS